jgi:hypothetical protein
MATFKQLKAIKLITTKNTSVKQAMREAGYSDSTLTNQLTRSKAYAEIMDKIGLTDDYLTRQIKSGLHARTGDKRPDWSNRHKYLDTALRVKGVYNEDNSGNSGNVYITNPLAVQVNTKPIEPK